MADNRTASGKKTLSKEQMRAIARRRSAKERRAMLTERRATAISNSRERARLAAGYGADDYDYGGNNGGFNGGNSYAPEVDHRFAADIQKMKFCRKPIGFLMNIVFIVAIALIAVSFLPADLLKGSEVNKYISEYTAVFAETEAKEPADEADKKDDQDQGGENEENKDENGGSGEETPANADDAEGSGEATGDGETGNENGGDGENNGAGENTEGDEASDELNGTYYKFSDPVYGWISYIAKQFDYDLSIGNSDWYDAQISKVETGMSDGFAAILIQAFPAAIILYVIFALALTIKTFICWASGDRRIYRHTWIECLIMIVLALVVGLGGFACTVDISGSMDFANIVDFLAGIVMKTGGFTAGYGWLIMVGLPVIGLILSPFLLEKKLRSRDITQPVIMYEYKESLGGGKSRR